MSQTRCPTEKPFVQAQEMGEIETQVRALARKLTSDQMLDLADLLHELIRERSFEARSWARLARRAH